jgi:predicted transport protein
MKKELEYFNLFSPAGQDLEERKNKISERSEKMKFDEEYHLKDRPSWICDLYFELDKFILNLKPNVRKGFLHTYIKYSYNGTLFTYILIRKGEIIRVWAKVPYASLEAVPLFVRDSEKTMRRPGVMITFDDQREFTENKEAMLKVAFEVIKKSFEGVASHKRRKKTPLKPVIGVEPVKPTEISRPSINIVADSNGYLEINFKIKKSQKELLNRILQETIFK